MQVPYKLALGACVMTTYGFHHVMQSRISSPNKSDNLVSPPSRIALEQSQAQMESIRTLLKDVKTKSTREKLEAAYDAATQTHEIGFPNFPGKKPPGAPRP
tara:strand:- start:204 stop:506 length:303 start_codon:yes stop_codon:yes gene_type:complete